MVSFLKVKVIYINIFIICALAKLHFHFESGGIKPVSLIVLQIGNWTLKFWYIGDPCL